MNIPDITLIITNWNGRELLRECLPSILKSVAYDKKRSYEIMVVDDCSSDDSLEVLAREFPTVRAEKTPVNYGFHGANNFGAGLARSRLIMPMNNDIKLDEEALYHLAEHFDEGKDTFSVSGKFSIRWPHFLWQPRRLFSECHFYLYEKNRMTPAKPCLLAGELLWWTGTAI